MMEQELITVWKSSAKEEYVKLDKSRLITDLKSSLESIDKKIKIRDLTEKIVALIMIPIFVFIAYMIPFFLTKIASCWIVLWLLYLVIKFHKLKGVKPGLYTDTYFDYLLNSKAYLTSQKKLLDSILYWYILPCLTGVVVFILGFKGLPILILVPVLLVVIGICLFVYFINKRAVKKELLPRIEKVDALIRVMNS